MGEGDVVFVDLGNVGGGGFVGFRGTQVEVLKEVMNLVNRGRGDRGKERKGKGKRGGGGF